MFIVLIETSGNQNYIFSSNKLRENIGASELTYRAGTQWILEGLSERLDLKRFNLEGQPVESRRLRELLLDPKINPPITTNESKAEVILATSGKALILIQSEEDARQLIRFVTYKALEQGPGIEIFGIFQEFDWERESAGGKNQAVHARFEAERANKPGSEFRYLRIPMVASCKTSGLPAKELVWDPETDKKNLALSAMSIAKRTHREHGVKRIQRLIQDKYPNHRFAETIDDLVKNQSTDWLAVIHADGNGLGEIFLKFHEHIQASEAKDNPSYVDKLRRFSLSLDICTENAFLDALSIFTQDETPDHDSEGKRLIPLTPLILGGDDLTVVCDGRFAIDFARKFLLTFEEETSRGQELAGIGEIIPDIAEQALGVRRLSACAGIAIIKNHFPFSVAYELAEDLMKSAKSVKNKVIHSDKGKPYPCSALDFHVLYDSSNVALDRIRGKLELDGGKTLLYCRPFVVTPLKQLQGASSEGLKWCKLHHWDKFIDRVKIIKTGSLPSTQLHDLRAILHGGKAIADQRYSLIRHRYPSDEVKVLEGEEESLFEKVEDKNTTRLMDCIDSATFIREIISHG